MGDLSKLNIAVGQAEIVEGRPSRNELAIDRMIGCALDQGADLLIVPTSLSDPESIRIIALNDSRIDYAGDAVVLDACDETYVIGLNGNVRGCDFSVRCDVAPFSLESHAVEPTALTIVARPVGMRDRGKRVITFDGGTTAFSDDASPIMRMRDDFSEDVQTFSLVPGGGQVRPTCRKKLLKGVVNTMRRFDELALGGAARWVIGLSGGLDSSVVAALLVLAFGPERVVGYGMSTRFNSAATRSNASFLAERLRIPLLEGSIEHFVVSLGNTLVGYGYPADALSGVVLENAQARARGSLLSTFAALEGGVVVNNGNRVESALGYATLYGDAIGALSPIGDLTKVQLFDLARDINDEFGFEAIPENLLPTETEGGYIWRTMPSAELARGQRDPMKWFYHDWLIGKLLGDGADSRATLDDIACEIMEAYLESKLLDSEVGKWVRLYGLDEPEAFLEDLNWVIGSMRRSAFKRIQAPPVISLASEASVRDGGFAQIAPELSPRFAKLSSRIRHM